MYITSLHPRPVKLKFEKVYQPCVLQTKKRYVGMKYESEDDPGEYEAKGAIACMFYTNQESERDC